MRFVVRHHSWYRYDVPVTLRTHVVRLLPRSDRARLNGHRLRVTPEPVAQRKVSDAFGNNLIELDFASTCQELRVEIELDLDTSPPPAITRSLPPLPWPADALAQLGYHGSAPAHASVRQFAEAVAAEAAHEPVRFLDHLTHTMYTRFDRHVRTSGDAHSAAETLALGRGACRDLSVLFMEAARCLGFASRFVSGYQAMAETVDGQRYLHAWPEVYLPDIGFCGWDPTHGVRVADSHVALCAAPEQAATMPIEGGFTFNGPVVRSTLDFTLRIDTRS